jgi:hypothetical protein
VFNGLLEEAVRNVVPKTTRTAGSQCKSVETFVFTRGNTMKEKVGMENEGSYRAPLYTP